MTEKSMPDNSDNDNQGTLSQTLDPLTVNFDKASLIEASAGTGKTYTISGLYLRLLLGHGGVSQGSVNLNSPLSCEQILVVTFTNAATEELRDRIRKRIALAYKCFMGLEVNDEFIQSLYASIPKSDHMQALRRLDLALKSLDEAAIFTIHGFCQRMLSDMAFESGLLFESEFTLDDSEYLHHAVRDFWRSACYSLPPYLAQIISNKYSDPDSLVRQLRPLLGASQALVLQPPKTFDEVSEQLSQSLARLQLIWPRERDAIEALLHSLPLNGVRFGKKAEQFPKLGAMLDSLDNWAKRAELSLPDLKVLDALSLSNLKLNKGGEIPTPQDAPVLEHIEGLLSTINAFTPAFLYSARKGIAQRFYDQKQVNNILSPDDLLSTLSAALGYQDKSRKISETDTPDEHHDLQDEHAKQLAKAIAQRFPVALIDEFQDTDPLQFAIFNRIYGLNGPDLTEASTNDTQENASLLKEESHTSSASLLMIGDPKQAIYAFRGADIYTYIQARSQTQAHYNLDTNYRSSDLMIQGVNSVFSQHADPFISQSIPFETVKPSPNAAQKQLIDAESGADSSALRLRLLPEDPDKGLNKADARQALSEDAANQIASLLVQAKDGLASIENKPLIAKDIAVLVRDRNEAAYIQQALRKRNIGSVFLSRDSVLETQEAREMALILKALANPRDEGAIRSALATGLIGYQASQILAFNQDENQRQRVLEQFFELNQIWLRRGIMPALLKLASDTQLISRLLRQSGIDADTSPSTPEETKLSSALLTKVMTGERRLTDFRHLSELLQQESTRLDGINALVNWYEQSLLRSQQGEEGQLRLESEQNLVQIVTIHKSKGLEYPVCLLPFISLARDTRRKPSPMLYHQDTQTQDNALVWDIAQTDEGWDSQKRETLAEDLRLLYVALTRPVHRCYLYIANHSRFTKKSGITSQLCDTGIGYLLGIEDKACDFERLETQVTKLKALSQQAISMQVIDTKAPQVSLVEQSVESFDLSPKVLSLGYRTPWRVASYSGLVKNLGHEKVAPGVDDESLDVSEQQTFTQAVEEISQSQNRFNFERGANAGSFMHLVLESIDFTQGEIDLPEQLPIAMEKFAIGEEWLPTLIDWYLDILKAPLHSSLDSSALCLADLSNNKKLVEMEFYLPLAHLNANSLNQLLSQYGYTHDLSFDELQGMLKGFIDLCFEHQGQYFIADYKSNHLGEHFEDYKQVNLHQAIRTHRYDLQYLLYTLALHRFLKQKLPHYSYEKHIGGCYYLFLRGMSYLQAASHAQSGVYFDKPEACLIEALDQLFSQANTQNEEQNAHNATQNQHMGHSESTIREKEQAQDNGNSDDGQLELNL